MVELNTESTQEELSKAIDNLACGMAPGADGITSDIIKPGKSSLLPHLHDLMCLCRAVGCFVCLVDSSKKE